MLKTRLFYAAFASGVLKARKFSIFMLKTQLVGSSASQRDSAVQPPPLSHVQSFEDAFYAPRCCVIAGPTATQRILLSWHELVA